MAKASLIEKQLEPSVHVGDTACQCWFLKNTNSAMVGKELSHPTARVPFAALLLPQPAAGMWTTQLRMAGAAVTSFMVFTLEKEIPEYY